MFRALSIPYSKAKELTWNSAYLHSYFYKICFQINKTISAKLYSEDEE